ncbi:MAG: glycosyl transferase [Butyrivibrio sp.]|nr:glycosyl transferase [Butyrivibrio sp.]
MQEKIPHIIHYFWFGGNEKSESVKKCIESWREFCPDFEIKEWNEKNYDFHKHPFMEEAYREGKWAFVSDYARLDVLYEHGGVYLDTDVEVLKDLSPLCENRAYMGFESKEMIGDGAGFGFTAGSPLLKEMMAEYDSLSEYVESPKLRTKILVGHGLIQDGTRQKVDGVEIYPSEYLSPKNYYTGKVTITENTYSIHHFEASWHESNTGFYKKLMRSLTGTFGEKTGMAIFKGIVAVKDALLGKGGKS